MRDVHDGMANKRRYLVGVECVIHDRPCGSSQIQRQRRRPIPAMTTTRHQASLALQACCAFHGFATYTTPAAADHGNGSDHKAHGNWLRQPSVHLSGGKSSISCSNRSTVSRQPRQQAPREASGKGMSPDAAASSQARHSGDVATVGPCATVNGGVAWAHGFTVSAGGLKVPLAPMPSRCKRARRVRASGGSVNVWDGGASDCIGTMGSGSGAMVV